MEEIDCPDELKVPQPVPGATNSGGVSFVKRYGEGIVGLTEHFLPRLPFGISSLRENQIRYDVVEAFVTDSETHPGKWKPKHGVVKDRPRLESAFQTSANRLDVSMARVKQACTRGYDTERPRTKLEQFLIDLRKIEICYERMETDDREGP